MLLIVFNSVLPEVQSLPLTIGPICYFMEELHAIAHQIRLPIGYTGPTILTLTTTLCNKYATMTMLSNTQAITDALRRCLRMQAPEACAVVVKRVVAVDLLTSEYINVVLVPLIPELHRLALDFKKLNDFASTFQTILLAWINKVLGPRPNDGGFPGVSSFSQWTCSCNECSPIRNFLKSDSPSRHISLEHIGAPRRKHVELYLRVYAQSACSWSTIATSPQGIKVRH